MISYDDIYDCVYELLSTRSGLNHSTKILKNTRELSGLMCGIARENTISSDAVTSFLELITKHQLHRINDTGTVSDISSLLDRSIVTNPLYNLIERPFMYFKPGNSQVGPGEFFMCLFDKDSHFEISPRALFDIVVQYHTTELKGLPTNFCSEKHLDNYASCDGLDWLFVVKPVSESKKPRKRSTYICCKPSLWRQSLCHQGVSLKFI
jgi:hypothetical protein